MQNFNLFGQMSAESGASSRVQKVVKSLRLIRLIRIIKLYKYIVQSKKGEDDSNNNKKKQQFDTQTEDENEQSLFMRETDPSKLGKALSDTTTRRVIIGVLLMLMVLPLLTYGEIDYSSEYGMRELFWFGRSSCIKAEGDFYCDKQSWLTNQGWYEMLRNYVKASKAEDNDDVTKEVLWLYLPDFTQNGRMRTIVSIPDADNNKTVYWT